MTRKTPGGFARFVALHADVQPSEYILETDTCTIGRTATLCNIVVARATVSRIHVQVKREGSHYVLQDVSRNPTYLNGMQVQEIHILQNQDVVGLALPAPLLKFIDDDPTKPVYGERLHYDEQTLTFFLHGEQVDLTPSQLRLLRLLYQRAGRVCTYDACIRAIWEDEVWATRGLDNLNKVIYGLRERLRKIAPACDLVQNQRGVGYILEQ